MPSKQAGGSGAGRKRSRKEIGSGAKEQSSKRSLEPEADVAAGSDGTESDDYDGNNASAGDGGAAPPFDDDSDDSESDEDIPLGMEDASSSTGHTMFDFNFFDPAPIDFHSVKRLLRDFVPGESDTFDSSGMADTVVAQPEVGTTVKVPDDDDVYSFATVLDMADHCKQPFLQRILHYVRRKAGPAGKSARLVLRTAERFLKQAVGTSTAAASKAESDEDSEEEGSGPAHKDRHGFGRVGLLLSERIINMPAELAPTLLKSLADDLEWSYSQGGEQVEPAASSSSSSPAAGGVAPYTHFLAVFRCFRDKSESGEAAAGSEAGGALSSSASSSSAAGAAEEDVPGHPGVHHLHFDEGLLCQHAISSVLVVAQPKKKKSAAAAEGSAEGGESAGDHSSSSSSKGAAAAMGGGVVTTGADRPSTTIEYRRIVLLPAASLPEAAAAAAEQLEAAAKASGDVPISVVDLITHPDAMTESAAGGLVAAQPAKVVKPGKRKATKAKGGKAPAGAASKQVHSGSKSDKAAGAAPSASGRSAEGEAPRKKKRKGGKKKGGGMSIVPL